MIVALAGTFNVIHDGHKALIDRAFSLSDDVRIGITSDSMASRPFMNPFYLRKKSMEQYLSSIDRKAQIYMIEDMYGPKEMMGDVDVLVVSEETLENGKLVSEWREQLNGKPLELSVVPLKTRDDGKKISSTDILNGECSRNGRTDVIDIGVGSLNPVKVEAVRNVMEKIYGQVRIHPEDVPSGVPEQPFEEETVTGAVNRAKAALKDHDLSVGIEAGVFDRYGDLYDVQHCAIVDQDGKVTLGMGSGFRYPDSITRLVREGKTVGEAVKIVYGSDIGREKGAIGILSRGLLDRRELTEQSVLNAMLPRIWEEK